MTVPANIEWRRSTEAKYWEMMGVLPPAASRGLGFLVGEPWDHGPCPWRKGDWPRFECWLTIPTDGMGERYVVGSRPITAQEFARITQSDLPAIWLGSVEASP